MSEEIKKGKELNENELDYVNGGNIPAATDPVGKVCPYCGHLYGLSLRVCPNCNFNRPE